MRSVRPISMCDSVGSQKSPEDSQNSVAVDQRTVPTLHSPGEVALVKAYIMSSHFAEALVSSALYYQESHQNSGRAIATRAATGVGLVTVADVTCD